MKYFIILLSLFIIPLTTNADVAPTPFNRGGTMFGIEDTMVEMTYEKVVISNFKGTRQGVKADIRADFIMTNLGGEDEKMKVYFPFYFVPYDDFRTAEVVNNIKVIVGGEELGYENSKKDLEVYFEVNFKAGEKTKISILYETGLQGSWSSDVVNVGYILHTGALWKNSIGEGEVIFEFPYSVEDQSKFFHDHGRTKFISNKNCDYGQYCISGNEIIYKFKNFEPTKSNDINYLIFNPLSWQRYIDVSKKLSQNKTHENYFELAGVYKGGFDGFRDEYFYAVNKGLGLKYPEKNIEYYEEALSRYTDKWELFLEQRCYNCHTDVAKVLELRKELNEFEDSNKKEELLTKIDYICLRKAREGYYRKKDIERRGEEAEEVDYQSIMGDSFEINEKFSLLVEYIYVNRISLWDDKGMEYLKKYKQRDYDFLEEFEGVKNKQEEIKELEKREKEQVEIKKQEKELKKREIEQEKNRKIDKDNDILQENHIQRNQKKQTSSIIVYLVTAITILISSTIFLLTKKKNNKNK